MDGIDGIAGSQAVFVATTGALLSATGGEPGLNACLYGLAGACAGFLVWNWPPAKVFMGDVGSGFLGFVLACCALYSTARGLLSLWSWLILMSAFLADATTTLARRALRGEKLSQAHRSHAYQVCARRLGGHRRVTLAFTLINLLWLLPLAFAATRYPAQAPLLTALAMLPLCLLAALLGAGQPERQSDGSGAGYPKPQ
jgi:Fuc2NAc and GlcNAc transferase